MYVYLWLWVLHNINTEMSLLQELLYVNETNSFKTAKGSVYFITNRGSTIRHKAPRPEHPGDHGTQEESQMTFYVTDSDANKIGGLFRNTKIKRAIVTGGSQATIKWLEGQYAGKLDRHALVNIKREPEVGLVPVELWNNGTIVHFGNKITEVN